MAESSGVSRVRMTGKVTRVLAEYGFVVSDDLPQQDVYFRNSWFRGVPPLRVDDIVTFELIMASGNAQARGLQRTGDTDARPLDRASVSNRLVDWAYLGYVPNTLSELAGIALPERWDFKNQSQDPDKPKPILYSYLTHTFGRLVLEKKVLINRDQTLAAFNTGLVDRRYEPIHALFVPNDKRVPWQLTGFCIAGEGADGQSLVRNFAPLPASANYFADPSELLFNPVGGEPQLDWKHIILDRIDRYPAEFIEDNCPKDFTLVPPSELRQESERHQYHADLGQAIARDDRTYRRIMNRVRDALDVSIKRAGWNFKTAIPTYYPPVRRLQLLLPLCLVSDERVDLALAFERTPSGSYLGHTALPLDWAYRNARLVCRPDSDWLAPEDIDEGPPTGEDG